MRKCDYAPHSMDIDEDILKELSEEYPVSVSNEEEEEGKRCDAESRHDS